MFQSATYCYTFITIKCISMLLCLICTVTFPCLSLPGSVQRSISFWQMKISFLGVLDFFWKSKATQIHSYWLHCLVPVNLYCNVCSTQWGIWLRWKQHPLGVWRIYRFHTRKKKSDSRIGTVLLHYEKTDHVGDPSFSVAVSLSLFLLISYSFKCM